MLYDTELLSGLDYRTQSFRNQICFCPQVKGETPTFLGPLDIANLNHTVSKNDYIP
jgi:hypothetical protein